MWLGCFAAITKPLRQHLPAVLVVMGFLQLFHNIWLSDIPHIVVNGLHLLLLFDFIYLNLVLLFAWFYVAGYQYRLNHFKISYFEVTVAYFFNTPREHIFSSPLFF